MKKYLQFLMVAVFAAVSLGLASCGDDKDEPKKPEENLPEATKKFVGYWSNISWSDYPNNTDFIFFNDGKCWKIGGPKSSGSLERAYWTFDANTNMLATTTASAFQILVTISTNDAWGGISPNSTNTVTYKKDGMTQLQYLLYNSQINKGYSNDYCEWDNNGKDCLGYIRFEKITTETLDELRYKQILKAFCVRYEGDKEYRAHVNILLQKVLDEGKFSVEFCYNDVKENGTLEIVLDSNQKVEKIVVKGTVFEGEYK